MHVRDRYGLKTAALLAAVTWIGLGSAARVAACRAL